ncbi:hypothetical protein V5799_003354 [Amblyomma americanum]|uniref:Uncharacterized protein n=1 Tax=Amblyomma americanum TaxID=6943 RepID=A0AAQ4D978_AMBAM
MVLEEYKVQHENAKSTKVKAQARSSLVPSPHFRITTHQPPPQRIPLGTGRKRCFARIDDRLKRSSGGEIGHHFPQFFFLNLDSTL